MTTDVRALAEAIIADGVCLNPNYDNGGIHIGEVEVEALARYALDREAECERLREQRDSARAMVAWMKSPAESCLEERATGNGGCGACAVCCKELRDRLDVVEAVAREAAPYVCPTCGPYAKVDEDECCVTCGADAVRSQFTPAPPRGAETEGQP